MLSHTETRVTHYLEFKDDKSSKFWMLEKHGNSHTVRYGKIGSDGRTSTKDFDSSEEARESAAKLLKSKLKKGYVETATIDSQPADVISDEEARQRFGLNELHVGNPDYQSVVVFEGNVEILGNVNDDTVESLFFSGERTSNFELVIIDGDLTIKGALDLTELYPCLLVRGDLRCDFVTSVDSYKQITGDAYITNGFIGHYNHGSMNVDGTTHVPLIFWSDHGCSMTPNERTVCINYYNWSDGFFEFDYYQDDLTNLLSGELFKWFDEEDYDFEWWKLGTMLKAGESPFLDGVAPELMTADEIRQLANQD